MPIFLILSLIKWFGIFVTAISCYIFYLLAAICFFGVLLGWAFGFASGSDCFEFVLIGFVIFMIPIIASWLIIGIGRLQSIVLDFIRS